MVTDLFLYAAVISIFILPGMFRKEKFLYALYKSAFYAGGFVTSVKLLALMYILEKGMGGLPFNVSFLRFSVTVFTNFRALVYGIIVRLVLRQFVMQKTNCSGNGEKKDRIAELRPELLSNREIEVVRLAAKGLTNAQIADELCISVVTVKRHLATVFKKTGINSRHELFGITV
ncbi:helix-turn-helix transcriptional regulator [Treponema sp. OMZ 840]|uniref:response regulator transcription factor n=1 Tax=Treponema sp. OMZ 840 TaxID=244313 RepID=UPI003D8A21AA